MTVLAVGLGPLLPTYIDSSKCSEMSGRVLDLETDRSPLSQGETKAATTLLLAYSHLEQNGRTLVTRRYHTR